MINRIYNVYTYWRTYGIAALFQIIIGRLANKLQWFIDNSKDLRFNNNESLTSKMAIPLRTYFLSELQTRRVNIITDSINSGSLFGGVGTALIFGALLANKLNAQLRIITRIESAKPRNIDHIFSLYGIKLEYDVQFKFAPFYDPKYEIDIVKQDLFLTTSWWTTAAALSSVPNENILYLLQEDERMFYPFGDERLRCETTLRNRDIRFLINTKLLFDHFVHDDFDNIADQGLWFEPAFPPQVFYPRPKDRVDKRKFFFYARPKNLRNLYNLGIEVIEQAIMEQVLLLEEWEIYFVGKDIPAVTFKCGYSPIKCENLSWSEYAQLVGSVDLGLSLMYTPHPSYPPLDLVASGAVVVTNRYANKRDLSNYSANLICADLDRDALVKALQQAIEIVTDSKICEQNYRNNGLQTDWQQSFANAINQFAGVA